MNAIVLKARARLSFIHDSKWIESLFGSKTFLECVELVSGAWTLQYNWTILAGPSTLPYCKSIQTGWK